MLIGPKIEGRRGGLVLEDLPTTLGAASGAAFEEALELNPTRAIGRIARLARERGEIGAEGFFAAQFFDPDRRPPSRVLPVEEANRRFAVGDLKFSEPTPEAVALMKHDFKRREIKRRDILARGPGGVIGVVVPLGAALVASVIDPLNIASAFVPVVSQTRVAALAARFGKTRARLVRGGIEGAVGTALLEPLVLAGASAIEADFGITDAMLDIVFGTVLGGGLHVGVGRLADFLGRQRPEVRRAALRAAVAQAAEGRTIDVEAVFRAELLGTTSRLAFEPDVRPRIEGLPERGAEPAEASIQRIVGSSEKEGLPTITYVARDIQGAEGESALLSTFTDPDAGGRVFSEIFVPKSVRGKGIAQRLYREALADGPLIDRPEFRNKKATRAIESLIKKGQVKRVVRDGKTFLEIEDRLLPPERVAADVGGLAVRAGDTPLIADLAESLADVDRAAGPVAAKTETVDEITAREDLPERDGASDFEAADEAERVLERSVDDPSQIDAKAEADEIEAELREDLGLPEAGAEAAAELPTELPPLTPAMVATVATRAETQGEVVSVLASDIEVDAGLFQFKADTDALGVGERLQGITEWDQRRAGVVTIYEFKDGRRFIVDGHQRLALAQRIMANDPAQQIRLNAFIDREVDGVTPAQARIIAAGVNIAEGSGTAIDAAKILRVAPETLPALPPRSALVQTAQGLQRLGDDAFLMVVNEVVQPTHAAVVGRMVADEPFQVALLRLLAETEPASVVEAESIVRQGIAAGFDRRTEATLFGEEEIVESLFRERAKILSRSMTALRQDRATFNTLVQRENAILGAGNVLDRASNVERLTDNAKALSTLQALANRKGPISDALSEAARDAKSTGSFKGATADFIETLRKAIREGVLDRPEEGGGRGVAEFAGDDRGQPRSAESANVTTEAEASVNGLFGDTKERLEAGPEPAPDDGLLRELPTDARRDLPPEIETFRQLLESDLENVDRAISRRTIDPPIENVEQAVEVLAADIADIRSRPSTEATIDKPERVALQRKLSDTLYDNGGHAEAASNLRTNPRQDRRVDIVLGPPAAGKSLQVAEPLLKEHQGILLDADEAKALLPEFDGGRGAAATHKESVKIAESIMLSRAVQAGDNIVQPLVGKNLEKIGVLISLYSRAGYDVHLHLVSLPADQAVLRGLTRWIETGRLVDPAYILSIGDSPVRTFDALKNRSDVDGFTAISTDIKRGQEPIVLERGGADADPGVGGGAARRLDQDAGRAPGEELTTEITEQGEQTVIPGAERISERELLERQGEAPLRPEAAQRASDDGLFDVSGRKQQDIDFGEDLVAKADSYGKAARAAALCLSRKP